MAKTMSLDVISFKYLDKKEKPKLLHEKKLNASTSCYIADIKYDL